MNHEAEITNQIHECEWLLDLPPPQSQHVFDQGLRMFAMILIGVDLVYSLLDHLATSTIAINHT